MDDYADPRIVRNPRNLPVDAYSNGREAYETYSDTGDNDEGDQEEEDEGSTIYEEEEEEDKEPTPPPRRGTASQKGKKVVPSSSAVSGVMRGSGVTKRPAKYGAKNNFVEKKRRPGNKDIEVTFDEIPGDDIEEDLSQPNLIVSRTKYLLGDRLYIQARKVHVNLKKKENSYSFEALTFCREPHNLQGEEEKEAFHYNFPAKYGFALYNALRKIYGRAIVDAFKDGMSVKLAGKTAHNNNNNNVEMMD